MIWMLIFVWTILLEWAIHDSYIDGSHAHATRSRPRLSDAAHVQPADRAESRWSLFIYFCSFLVLKIYDRTFATLLRLFTQANTSAEKMILVMKGLGFLIIALWYRSVLVGSSLMSLPPTTCLYRCLRGGGALAAVALWLARAGADHHLMLSKGQYARV